MTGWLWASGCGLQALGFRLSALARLSIARSKVCQKPGAWSLKPEVPSIDELANIVARCRAWHTSSCSGPPTSPAWPTSTSRRTRSTKSWPLPSTPSILQRRIVPGSAARAVRSHCPALSADRAVKMFVAISYAKMNRVRAAKYAQMKSARLHARQLRQLPLHVSGGARRRRQLLHPRRQHGAAVREDRQQRDALERQSHRARLGHRGSLLHHLARRRLGHVRVGECCFIGVNATLRNSITIAPRHAHRRRAR